MPNYYWDTVDCVMRLMPLRYEDQDRYLRWLVSRPPIIRINRRPHAHHLPG